MSDNTPISIKEIKLIRDFIEKKIITLQSNRSGKVFFGNIGTEVVIDGDKTFYPQFPDAR